MKIFVALMALPWLLLFLCAEASGEPTGPEFPRLLYYSSALNTRSEATRDSLARADVLIDPDRPEAYADMRRRNPDLRVAWQDMPQMVHVWDGRMTDDHGRPTWWLADTLWSLNRLMTFYAVKNDWIMPDTRGRPKEVWGHYLLNWTRFCPKGRFGASRGLRAAEFYPIALRQIALSGARGWRPWCWDDLQTVNALMIESQADCWGSYGLPLADCDPNRDGRAEGVTRACAAGGYSEPLSVLFRAENAVFWAGMQREVLSRAPDFRIWINDSNRWMGPAWRTRLNGMKIENFFRYGRPWCDGWFDPSMQIGYRWAESYMGRPGLPDDAQGWDQSIVCVYEVPGEALSTRARRMRLGLGTALLGDGFFCASKAERFASWIPEMGMHLGRALGPYQAIPAANGDSLYWRRFEGGIVAVNPTRSWCNGVPPEDARFWGFGLP